MKIHGLKGCSKEEKEQIKKVVAADQKRMKFVRGGMTAKKLYKLESRLDGVIDTLRKNFGLEFGDELVEEVHDIRLIIEWFGKSIDPRCR
jgi:hypothetical protein